MFCVKTLSLFYNDNTNTSIKQLASTGSGTLYLRNDMTW